jgi:hypothetical protein
MLRLRHNDRVKKGTPRHSISYPFPLSLSYNRDRERRIPRKGSFFVKETGSEPPYCNTSKSHFENYVKFSKGFELEFFLSLLSKLLKSHLLKMFNNKDSIKGFLYKLSFI